MGPYKIKCIISLKWVPGLTLEISKNVVDIFLISAPEKGEEFSKAKKYPAKTYPTNNYMRDILWENS
jgi:hypothetical protein